MVEQQGAHAAPADDQDQVPTFRAVMAGGTRRGIRLEQLFWRVLALASRERGVTIGQLVADAVGRVPEEGNLSSTLRVIAARWQQDRIEQLEAMAASENAFGIVHACPAPAFVLALDRRILQYNQLFLNFIQSRLFVVDTTEIMRSVRLTLDVQIDAALAQLRRDGRSPVVSGFVLSVGERRLRGQVRLALAASGGSQCVMAFITQG